jgi:hypothetical protein
MTLDRLDVQKEGPGCAIRCEVSICPWASGGALTHVYDSVAVSHWNPSSTSWVSWTNSTDTENSGVLFGYLTAQAPSFT